MLGSENHPGFVVANHRSLRCCCELVVARRRDGAGRESGLPGEAAVLAGQVGHERMEEAPPRGQVGGRAGARRASPCPRMRPPVSRQDLGCLHGPLVVRRGRSLGAPVPVRSHTRPPLPAQGNMAHPNMVAWHEKEGKPQAGFLELTPGSTLVVLEPEKGAWRAQPRPSQPPRHAARMNSHRRLSALAPVCPRRLLLAHLRRGSAVDSRAAWHRQSGRRACGEQRPLANPHPVAPCASRRLACGVPTPPLHRAQSWAEALTNLIAGLAPVAGDDGGPIKDRLVPASK